MNELFPTTPMNGRLKRIIVWKIPAGEAEGAVAEETEYFLFRVGRASRPSRTARRRRASRGGPDPSSGRANLGCTTPPPRSRRSTAVTDEDRVSRSGTR